MQWYKEMLNDIEREKTYCHKELADKLKTIRPDLSESAYHWALNGLVHEGVLVREGYNSYVLSSGSSKGEYVPEYSELSKGLIKSVSDRFPHVKFAVFETALLNEFLNHMIAQNTVFIQVEKESSIYVFRFLQECGFKDIMYKPGKKDFDLYWSKDCIVVTDMVSEAPLRTDTPHSIMLEKMLVDLSADKLIAAGFSKAEYPDIMEQAQKRYLLDKVRMLRYARRRNRQNLVLEYLEGGAVEDAAG